MANICTTLDQSKELLRLGLDPKTSDMLYIDDDEELLRVEYTPEWPSMHTPAWSLNALLGVLKEFRPNIALTTADFWMICTVHETWMDMNIINACQRAVVWYLENGYIKKVKKGKKA